MNLAIARVDSVAREVRDSVDPSTVDGDVEHWSIPSLDATGGPIREPATDIGSAKIRLQGGEVLVSRLNPRKARVVAVPEPLEGTHLCSGEFVVLRPTTADQRYLWYALSTETTRQGLDARVQSVTRSHQRVRPELVTHLRIPVPPLAQQRRVVRLLDAETSRIDELVANKRRMICVSAEHLDALREDTLWAGERLDLRHIVDVRRPVMYGIVLPGPNVDGIDSKAIIKGGDVANRFSRPLNRTTAMIESKYERSRVKAGDLVICIRGGIGDVARVPEWADGANLTQDVARVAPASGVSGRWLRHVLASPSFQAQVEAARTGATITGLNIGDLKLLKVPVAAPSDATTLGARLDRVEGKHDGLSERLTTQISLLKERRQALITAAVTGEIEV